MLDHRDVVGVKCTPKGMGGLAVSNSQAVIATIDKLKASEYLKSIEDLDTQIDEQTKMRKEESTQYNEDAVTHDSDNEYVDADSEADGAANPFVQTDMEAAMCVCACL